MPADAPRYLKATSVSRTALGAALALGLWALPWAMWPSNARSTVPLQPKAPLRVHYVRAAQGLDETAWSPVVFPLPTKFGFSEKADARSVAHEMEAVLRPRLAESSVGAVSREPEAIRLPLPETNPRPDMFRLEPVEEPAYTVFPKETDRIAEAVVSESLAARHFRAPGLAGVTSSVPVSAYIELDAAGCVKHVFLETSSGVKASDQEVLRVLRTGEADPGVGGVGGWVRVSARSSVPE